MSEFLRDPRTHAPPQSFRMGDLLHEMKEIEQRNQHLTPVRGGCWAIIWFEQCRFHIKLQIFALSGTWRCLDVKWIQFELLIFFYHVTTDLGSRNSTVMRMYVFHCFVLSPILDWLSLFRSSLLLLWNNCYDCGCNKYILSSFVFIFVWDWINYKNIREVDTIVLMVMLIITDS